MRGGRKGSATVRVKLFETVCAAVCAAAGIATCVDGRVYVKWTDNANPEVLDLSTLPHVWLN